MNKARIRVNNIAALVFWNDGDGFDRTAVVLPGVPYETSQDPLTPLLLSSGFGVIQPQYIGTFDSKGELSPDSCIETVFQIRNVIAQHETLYDLRGERSFRIGHSMDLLTGHSFGSFVAMGSILRGIGADRSLLLSPMFEFGIDRERAGIRLDMERHVRHIAAALPLTFRLKSERLWRKFFISERRFHPEPRKTSCQHRTKLLVIAGDDDPSLEVTASRRYVTDFVARYSTCLELTTFVTVSNGTHDTKSLLTPEVEAQVRSFVALAPSIGVAK